MKKQYSIKPNNVRSVMLLARTVKCSMKPQKSNPPRAKQNWANNFHPRNFLLKTSHKKSMKLRIMLTPRNTFKYTQCSTSLGSGVEIKLERHKNGRFFSRGYFYLIQTWRTNQKIGEKFRDIFNKKSSRETIYLSRKRCGWRGLKANWLVTRKY